MGRAPCCDKASVKKGPWSPEEDRKLKEYIHKNGTGGNWIALPRKAGLKRCGKSCRLRWLNYLRPNIKHGDFSDEEDRIICSLFATIGSRWSIIAAQLPGRTDNDIKNYWNTKLKKKLMHGLQPYINHNHHIPKQQQLLFPTASAAAAAAPLEALPMSLLRLSSPHNYSHHHYGYSDSSNKNSMSLLSTVADSRGVLNGSEEQMVTTSCFESRGGLGPSFDELCATTSGSSVHGHVLGGTEAFVFGSFPLQEGSHKAPLLAAGAADQLDEQYNASSSCRYGEAKSPLVTLTSGGNGAGGTSSSFFYDSRYSEVDETAKTTSAAGALHGRFLH